MGPQGAQGPQRGSDGRLQPSGKGSFIVAEAGAGRKTRAG